MTIYAKEHLFCGCIVKKYIGGKIIYLKKCEEHQFKRTVVITCGVCGQEMTKKELKDTHRWTHAI